jgi:5-methylcytosine-specific restriction endonuclease McrA
MKTQVIGETYSKQRLMLHRSQEYMCALCGIRFIPGEAIQIDHIIPSTGAARTTWRTSVWFIPGAIDSITNGRGSKGPRLEPDEG